MNRLFSAAASRVRPVSGAVLLLAIVLCYPQHAATQTIRVLFVSNGVSPGSPFSRPLSLFFDKSKNECYVADTGNNRIVVCDNLGMPVHHFYHRITLNDEKKVGEPKSIVVNSTGKIFLTDTSVPYIDILDPLGRSITHIDPFHEECGDQGRFDFLSLGPDDEIYATLACEKRHIAVIGPDLTISKIITLDAKEQKRPCITAIAVTAARELFIADPCGETMIQHYSPEGDFLAAFGQHETGIENFSYPTSITIMTNGDLWIADAIRQIVSRFTQQGEFLSYLGGKGVEVGAFQYPSSVSTNGDDLLFVLERIGQRFQCFQLRDSEITDEKADNSLSVYINTSNSE